MKKPSVKFHAVVVSTHPSESGRAIVGTLNTGHIVALSRKCPGMHSQLGKLWGVDAIYKWSDQELLDKIIKGKFPFEFEYSLESHNDRLLTAVRFA